MNRSVQQLAKQRTWALGIAGMLCCLVVMAALLARIPQTIVFFLLIFVGGATYYLILRYFNKIIGKRLVYLAAVLMDPRLIQEEAGWIYRSDSSWKSRYGKLYYESSRLSHLGDFHGALEACEKMPALPASYQDAKECGRMLLCIRAGNLDKAEALFEQISKLETGSKLLQASCRRTLGAYFLEKGDYQQADSYLQRALQEAQYPVEQLGVNYDLGRCYEKQGNTAQALSHYQTAISLGPKTWMGQEAAQRAAVLSTEPMLLNTNN